MAQSFQALECYQCHTFQVQIKKKSTRWACKLCGEKQSLIKIYGEGSSKDCRIHVQKLNLLRAAKEEAERSAFEATNETEGVSTASSLECMGGDVTGQASGTSRPESKWTTYLENDSENSVSDTEEDTQVPEIHHSKIKTIPNSKWATYIESDSPSTAQGMVKCGADQTNLSNSRRQIKGQRSPAWNGYREEAGKSESEFCDKNSTPQHKRTPQQKRRSSAQANSSPFKKLCEVDAKQLECSTVNIPNMPKRSDDKDCTRGLGSTECDELDEILKL